MNGNSKFHSPTGPAFFPGEEWISSCGYKVSIISIRGFGDGKWDYEVSYKNENGVIYENDAWNFQVRYSHVADKKL